MLSNYIKRYVFSGGLLLLFLVAPLYDQPNIGTRGLNLTYNIPVWIVASWMMAAGLVLVTLCRHFSYPRYWVCFVLFPLITIGYTLLMATDVPISWFFRQLFILGGLVFLFALFQFSARQAQLDKVLYVIVLAMGCQALLGALQIADVKYIREFILAYGAAPTIEAAKEILYNNLDVKRILPDGNFQQINVQVSFLATGLIATLYLISRPAFRSSGKISQAIIAIAVGLAVYIISSSGSRTGLLALGLGVPILLWSRYYQLRQQKKLLIILFIASVFGVVSGYHAWSDRKALEKTISMERDRMKNQAFKTYPVSRIDIYTIALELIAKAPIFGHGIGGFLPAWNKQTVDFAARHPDGRLPVSNQTLHPHNETLFWAIEGGLIAVIGLVAVGIGIMLALAYCGLKRGGAYLAMLLPISLHTQVELPFYHSAVHFFLWLFLIYLVLRHQTNAIKVSMTPAATWLLRIIALTVGVMITLFMIHTARAQTDLYLFIYEQEKAQKPYLHTALNNLYLKPVAEYAAMNSNLYADIEQNNRQGVIKFEKWALDYSKTNPLLWLYQGLIDASIFLRPEGKGCDYIKAGLAMYPYNGGLKEGYATRCLSEQ